MFANLRIPQLHHSVSSLVLFNFFYRIEFLNEFRFWMWVIFSYFHRILSVYFIFV